MNSFKVGGLTLGSSVLVAFLALWEGGGQDGMTVYADKLAGGLPTACYGITKHVTDVPVIVGEYWPKEKCDRVMSVAVTKVQLKLLSCLTHQPPQPVFDAISSHAWNFGYPKTCSSNSVSHINEGDYSTGCNLLATTYSGKPNWSYVTTVNGKVFIQGLYNRRQAERDNLCLAGLYE